MAYEAVVREDDDLRREQDRLHGEIELLHVEIQRLHGEAEKQVSRLAYETVTGERDNLREQAGELVQHIVRMDRVEHGKAEVPREQRSPVEKMPDELRKYINGMASLSTQKMMIDAASIQHTRYGVPWSKIIADTIPEEDRKK